MNPVIQVPERVGAIILTQATLFPSSYLPLHIFEPRYRRMLAAALETHRMFAVASKPEESPEAVHAVGGLGIVRACVSNPDGTSNLILQGLVRVRFDDWTVKDGYPFARIMPIEPEAVNSPENPRIQREILAVLERAGEHIPGHLISMLSEAPNPSVFADLAAAALGSDPPVRQRLLEEPHATRRLEILAAYLSSSAAFAG
ncbi:MAG: LON peptidase substrate-binding domain-containing protein [Terrimicrobiaceae bacterium]|nr:LON peptidase substrate-binding domain-containing protein [Terrimicrobiaceae bacterium]